LLVVSTFWLSEQRCHHHGVRSALLSTLGILCLIFEEQPHCFVQWLSFYLPAAIRKGSAYSTIFITCYFCYLFNLFIYRQGLSV
jgi:hypothetical protein